jgi:hypothetical protein
MAALRTLALIAAVAACTPAGEPIGPDGRYVVDNRAAIPEPDPRYLDIVSPEVVIEPGEEKQLCYHQVSHGELAVRGLGTRQGRYGHHISLMTSSEPKPEGTLEDCTDAVENGKLLWFVLAFEPLPAGYAIDIPDGTPYLMQFHYINTTDEPMLVRDVARLLRADPATVTSWVSTLITTDLAFQLPPGKSTRSWDCTLAEPHRLMIVSGHMHELGTRFTLGLSNGGDPMQTVYQVDPWMDSFRDTAPTTVYYGAPLELRAGSVLRTTCDWTNTGDQAVGYPVEMCILFAYVAGTKRQLQCMPPA